jgi:adenylate cyclase
VGADSQDPSDLREQIAVNQASIDRLNRELAKKTNDVRIIQQISSEITSTLDLDEVLGIVLRAMEEVLGFQYSMVLLKDPADEALTVAATRGYAQSGAGARVRVGDGVIGVVASRRCVLSTGLIPVSEVPRAVRRMRLAVQDRSRRCWHAGPWRASPAATARAVR